MKPILTIETLIHEAKLFCETESKVNHLQLIGVKDGKAVGTYIEHKFKTFLEAHYTLNTGNSAYGIDLPSEDILTDIKATSKRQPQSSCPFEDARQKIYGLGYNLLVFVYERQDTEHECTLHFSHCTFVDKTYTADYTITRRLRQMLEDDANKEDIIGYLQDKNLPGDEIVYNQLADEILRNAPNQGYLTISNAWQWRLSYSRVIKLNNEIKGITNYEW